ncbi:hypothetical protein GCM10023142_34220 [Anaerocolumna aminovalerica]|uniref:Glucoamylase (Glucan-1,4-alpha-glucosidase), GH15 family n=1 Tax=Anaerocolumna aminovalerica TaxID=1527 RepID=A0A1I5GNF2_9FIRM|nr:hypothetical protein [Anaerocolumna aminovalerica]SFO37467.1 Glucoamylase (glucan-1,4-alpha-glucosidase), GH15 family [Anaerocolumna aminovalerica]
MKMDRKPYTGVGLVGNENVAAIYTVNNGIIDINGTGIYHLFYKNYKHDLLQSAVSMIRVNDRLYFGNRKWNEYTHPHHLVPERTEVLDGFRYTDNFILEEDNLEKTDIIYAYGNNRVVFETTVSNKASEAKKIGCFGYIAVRNEEPILGEVLTDDALCIQTGEAYIGMATCESNENYIVEDSPTDFSYQTFLDVKNRNQKIKGINTNCRVGCVKGKEYELKAGESITFQWALVFADTKEELINDLQSLDFKYVAIEAKEYWKRWLAKGNKRVQEVASIHKNDNDEEFLDFVTRNRIAMKAVCQNGFIPADLTGHYYSNKMPCYYARDSIMVARGFLLAGHYEECEEIIQYLIKRKRKSNGEFYQRYDGLGEPNEGANNNVSHQIDSIGYFGRIVYEFYKRTGKILASEELLQELVSVIENSEHKNGMVGPEGGVNEGVFGAAFITSSNMFIYGGIKAMEELFVVFENKEYEKRCQKLCEQIYQGIQTTFNKELERYDYGYVNYHDRVVCKYDTPQYFGPIYGYPNDENMKKTHEYFLKHASFFKDGIGYSEQEYHHGPWLFNTLACAEYCKVHGEASEYRKKMLWAKNHANAYGLMPEAVDANDESISFINPLTWACAEFVASYYR